MRLSSSVEAVVGGFEVDVAGKFGAVEGVL